MMANSFINNFKKYLEMGFKPISNTSVRKEYGLDSRKQPFYIRLSKTKTVVSGLGIFPQEMSADIKKLREMGVL